MGANPLWKIDFHCHSEYSRDSRSKLRDLIQRAKDAGLDRLVLTDHNTIRGALAARELDPDFVIAGEEILTTRGELLAFFVEREVPKGLSPEAAIERLRAQDAFISVSHPFDLNRHGWQQNELDGIRPLVDAIEVFNARCLLHSTNQRAAAYAARHGLAGTAGSDAHLVSEVGRALTLLAPFDSAEGLRKALPAATIEARYSSLWVHLGSTLAKFGR